jgi:hypothetical protein
MPIYKEGSDLTPLIQAADEQKKARRAAGPEARAAAGLAPISNLMVRPNGTAYKIDYSASSRSGETERVPVTDHPVSGSAVAERRAKLIKEGKESKAKPSTRRGVPEMSGVIKNGLLQPPAAERRADEAAEAAKPKAKGKPAAWKDVKQALKSGKITAEDAQTYSPRKMKPTVDKPKKK